MRNNYLKRTLRPSHACRVVTSRVTSRHAGGTRCARRAGFAGTSPPSLQKSSRRGQTFRAEAMRGVQRVQKGRPCVTERERSQPVTHCVQHDNGLRVACPIARPCPAGWTKWLGPTTPRSNGAVKHTGGWGAGARKQLYAYANHSNSQKPRKQFKKMQQKMNQ